MAAEFDSIPILEFGDALSATTKPRFLSSLRHALVKVGFFYLRNPPIGAAVRDDLVRKTASFFDLPMEKKQEVAIANSRHFRGYASLGIEKTATKRDQRETLTVGFDEPARELSLPAYHSFFGPNQWLPESTAPGLRHAIETYLGENQALADVFVVLVAEALDMDRNVFTRLLEKDPLTTLRIAAYPDPGIDNEPAAGFQGVGPHKDGNILTYLLQGTDHSGLEVQNRSGKWIPVPPIPDTLVVNIGRSLEVLTKGVCVATTHRVNLRSEYYHGKDNAPLGTRLTFPCFQMLSLNVTREEMELELPSHILSLREEDVKSDAETYFEEVYKGLAGEALLINAITSYPDAGRRWYPDLMAEVLEKQQVARQKDIAG
ncbi:hypothetical protein N7533_011123 [Penicillium manginii]|uniref:uncharacterized protein n=1 Tax=Penicillium manginii TaxID=203109 RepID=UPI002546B242|nr:uncharacterized protein N7533_011123 [Penicillium manginii]KAJ5741714.1 hypothetical protein N7533_011123 [Penicillium manginii]